MVDAHESLVVLSTCGAGEEIVPGRLRNSLHFVSLNFIPLQHRSSGEGEGEIEQVAQVPHEWAKAGRGGDVCYTSGASGASGFRRGWNQQRHLTSRAA